MRVFHADVAAIAKRKEYNPMNVLKGKFPVENDYKITVTFRKKS
jgi:hypothetical protein